MSHDRVSVKLDNGKLMVLGWSLQRQQLLIEVWAPGDTASRQLILEATGTLSNAGGALEDLLAPLARAFHELRDRALPRVRGDR